MNCEWCENDIDEDEIYDVGGELTGCCEGCLEAHIPADDRTPIFVTRDAAAVDNG